MTFCRWRGEIHMNGRRIGALFIIESSAIPKRNNAVSPKNG